MICEGLMLFLMHQDPLCDRVKDLVKESRMIYLAEARLYEVSAKITASSGTKCEMGHKNHKIWLT